MGNSEKTKTIDFIISSNPSKTQNTIIMFSTNFYDNDDHFGYHHPRRHRYYNQRSVDEYLRRKEQEELEAAYARQRRKELYEQQLYERRRQQAMAQRERELMEKKRRQRILQQQMQDKAEHDDDNDNYQIEIAYGRDGNLYYVKRPVQSHPKARHQPTITEDKAHRSRRELQPDPVIQEELNSDSSDPETDNDDEEYLNRQRRTEPTVQRRQNRRNFRKKSPKRRITVTVEDASDSECESEFDSPWRNRRPSPGQWMEPVDPFYD